ncbi:MAG: hypothetical protein IT385_14805 [Deltaproteobacteria bacterium]|nr:hypothetical protein [Deltaproteobacteria bacterium]
MRLRFLAASVPAALLSIACDGHIDEPAPSVTAPSTFIELGRKDIVRKPIDLTGDQERIARPQRKLGREQAPAQPDAPAPTTPTPPAPVDSCEATLGSAWSAIEDARREAAAGCQRDAECAVTVAPTGCGGMDLFAVSVAQRGWFLEAVAGIDKDLCDTLGPDCAISSSCIFGTPIATCEEGACRLDIVEPTDAGTCNATPDMRDTVEGCVDCGLAAEKATNELWAVADELAACEVDSDCVQVTDDTGCGSTCGLAIHKDQLAAYDAARADIQSDWCTGGDCPIFMAGCLPQEPRCDAGRCELVGTW